jgi:hypothetical protein
VLVNGAPAAVRDAVAAWLAFAAAARPEHRDPLVDLLITAAADDFWALGQLSQAFNARAWSERPSDSGAAILRDRLADRLSQAKVST